jgi:hypothetical protein
MFRKLILVSSLALASQAFAAEAGKITFVAGAVHVAERAGVEGAAVQEGELLSTGADGYLYVKTLDDGLFILRPNTKARIVTYHVDARNPANTRVKLELISGVARSKSGDAVKLARQNFRFNTPVAAIGVRGTDFTVFTDQDTSRVAVLTGRIVMSGFAGGCRPDGGGPCEGSGSRELSATQRGQLLQVKRGQEAPQLLQSSGNSPDLVSPPRADEPVAKTGNAADPILEAKKSESIDKLVQQQQQQQQQPQQPSDPVLPPPIVGGGEPQLPEREIQWGRWAAVKGYPVTGSLSGPANAERIIGGDYVIYRTAGKDWVAPERGSVGFSLRNSEAFIKYDDPNKDPVLAQVQNGQLTVDFGKSTFTTSFDLVGAGSTVKMYADGSVTSTGLLTNDRYNKPQTNNMMVDGALSNANGGTAAYIFQRRLDDTRTTNGVTFWSR